jgi:DNA mismatch repair protein MutL
LIPQGRYAAAVLFLDIRYRDVDVNAHPAKVEIRFRESEKVRFFILSELKKALTSFGAMKPTTANVDNFNVTMKASSELSREAASYRIPSDSFESVTEKTKIESRKKIPYAFSDDCSTTEPIAPTVLVATESLPNLQKSEPDFFLGNAVCQICEAYIVAENGDDLIIVDQHAAAERIMLEKLKNNLSLDSQTLLLPEVCSLKESQIEQLEKYSEFLMKFGIHYEKITDDLIHVTALPAILGDCDAKALLNGIAEELSVFGDAYSFEEKIHKILATISCHRSVRAGRKLSVPEMNSLLRQMEKTENIAQCCHGRPSYIILSSNNLNKFFERY